MRMDSVDKAFDLIASAGLFLLVVLVRKTLPQAMGGSLVLLILFPFFLIYGYLCSMRREASYLNLLLLLLVGLNVTSYSLKYGIVAADVLVIVYNGIVAGTVFTVSYAVVGLLSPVQPSTNADRMIVLRRNFLWSMIQYPLWAFLYSLFLSLAFASIYEQRPPWKVNLELVPTCYGIVLIFFAILLFSLTSHGKQKIAVLMKKKDHGEQAGGKIDPRPAYKLIIGVTGIGGTIIEVLFRQQYLLWVETFLTINVIAWMAWRVDKYRRGTVDYGNIPEEKSILTPGIVGIEILIHSFVMTLLGVVLIEHLLSGQ
jgi:hypothetical protein